MLAGEVLHLLDGDDLPTFREGLGLVDAAVGALPQLTNLLVVLIDISGAPGRLRERQPAEDKWQLIHVANPITNH